mmetsp:Transcript_18611/g.21651  ORF Transcript_18611/g.21651 Transcript_18611/m.21651 type:complete len:148 (-) Transcript_18611:222-665(-)
MAAVCPPTPRLAPGQDPIEDMEPLELPPLDEDEAPATICSVAPKAPRLSPSPVPFENCTIPELWLPEAGSTDDEYEVSATGFMTGPSWDLQELSSCGYRGERFSVQLPSSVCSTRCSSPGGMSSTDSPWPANCDKRESMPLSQLESD